MTPPLLDNVPEFFQHLDFLLFSRKEIYQKHSPYRQLVKRCLDQTASESDVFQWLDREESPRYNKSFNGSSLPVSQSRIQEFFIKRCQEKGAEYIQVYSLNPYRPIYYLNNNLLFLKIKSL